MQVCFTKATSKNKSKGRTYYINNETGISRWGLPIYDESTELKVEKKVSSWEVVPSFNVDPRRVYFTNPLERISQWNQPPKVEHVEDEPLADGWEKTLSKKCKNIYYVNKKENKSQWEIPSPISAQAKPTKKEIEEYGKKIADQLRAEREEPPPVFRPRVRRDYLIEPITQAEQDAADVVNKMAKARKARKAFQDHQSKHSAATAIQAAVRRSLEKNRPVDGPEYDKEEAKKRDATIAIQASVRRALLKNRPVDEEEARPKGLRVPPLSDVAKPTNKRPRGLKWVDNSCYLDSALFAFFAGPKDFIDKILNTEFEGVREQGKCTIANLKKIQTELRKIYKSITREGRVVEYCNDLRKSLKKCPHEEGFHTDAQADSGEFISYLISLFPEDKNFMTTKTYYTNSLEVSLERLKTMQNTPTTKTVDHVELIQIIDSQQISSIDDADNVMLSEFLTEILDGKLDEPYIHKGVRYVRRAQIRKLTFSPYLIFSLMRLIRQGGTDIYENIIIPDDTIDINGQLFSLTGAVMYNGHRHYVAIAKYNGSWWYYNDVPYQNSTSLLEFRSFEEFLSKVDELDLVNPLTHGTQFYYTPV